MGDSFLDKIFNDSSTYWWDNIRHNYLNKALVSTEKSIAGMLGISDVLDYASRRPRELGFEKETGGQADALRHLLLAGELQRTSPVLGPLLLWGHEHVTNFLQRETLEDVNQDDVNNLLGMAIGKRGSSRNDVEQMSLAAMRANLPVLLPIDRQAN